MRAMESLARLSAVADADESVMRYMGRENIVYVNVANKLSVDCDCDGRGYRWVSRGESFGGVDMGRGCGGIMF